MGFAIAGLAEIANRTRVAVTARRRVGGKRTLALDTRVRRARVVVTAVFGRNAVSATTDDWRM